MTALTEKEWQAQVRELATRFGWRTYHTHDSRRSDPGFPDLCLVRDDRIIFAELKTDQGAVRPDQRDWLKALAQTPAEAYLWRPAHLAQVQATLNRKQGSAA